MSRWKISDRAPVYALVLLVAGFVFFFSAVALLLKAFGNLPAIAQWVLVVLAVALALFVMHRIGRNCEPQNEEEVRWWEIK